MPWFVLAPERIAPFATSPESQKFKLRKADGSPDVAGSQRLHKFVLVSNRFLGAKSPRDQESTHGLY
jgi:hypothetical protein